MQIWFIQTGCFFPSYNLATRNLRISLTNHDLANLQAAAAGRYVNKEPQGNSQLHVITRLQTFKLQTSIFEQEILEIVALDDLHTKRLAYKKGLFVRVERTRRKNIGILRRHLASSLVIRHI